MSAIDKHIFHSEVVGALIKEALEFFDATPLEKLPLETPFTGRGVYALYYTGRYDHYSFYTKRSTRIPIYIGKAVPSGWRQGRLSTEASAGRELYRRIKEHAKNIDGSENLDSKDIEVRFMVFRDDTVNLISTIESALIRKYNPLWNSIVDGFGNHDPGKGRYNQAVSEWDFLHPGRIWVARLTGQRPEMEQIISKIRKYIEGLDG